MGVQFYVSTSNVQEFPFLYILTNTCYLPFFDYGHPGGCAAVSHWAWCAFTEWLMVLSVAGWYLSVILYVKKVVEYHKWEYFVMGRWGPNGQELFKSHEWVMEAFLKSTTNPFLVTVSEFSHGWDMPYHSRWYGSTEIIHPGSSLLLSFLSFLPANPGFCSLWLFLPSKEQITWNYKRLPLHLF